MPLQDADEIDHRVGFRDERGKLRRIVHIGFDHVDGEQGEMRGVGAPSRGDAHGLAEIDKRVDEMTADEARTADQRYVLMSHIGLCLYPRARDERGGSPGISPLAREPQVRAGR